MTSLLPENAPQLGTCLYDQFGHLGKHVQTPYCDNWKPVAAPENQPRPTQHICGHGTFAEPCKICAGSYHHAVFDRVPAVEPQVKAFQHPEDLCGQCGNPNPFWFVANDLWNRVVPERSGILCPTCFIERANKIGLDSAWELVPEFSKADHRPEDRLKSAGTDGSSPASARTSDDYPDSGQAPSADLRGPIAGAHPPPDETIQNLWRLRDDVEIFIQHDGADGSVDYDAARVFKARHDMLRTVEKLRRARAPQPATNDHAYGCCCNDCYSRRFVAESSEKELSIGGIPVRIDNTIPEGEIRLYEAPPEAPLAPSKLSAQELKAKSFKITYYSNGGYTGYKVSIPNYEGGEVVRLEDAREYASSSNAALEGQLREAREAPEQIAKWLDANDNKALADDVREGLWKL